MLYAGQIITSPRNTPTPQSGLHAREMYINQWLQVATTADTPEQSYSHDACTRINAQSAASSKAHYCCKDFPPGDNRGSWRYSLA